MKITRIHHLNCGSIHAYVPRIQAIVYCLRRFAQAHSDEVRLISGHDIDSFKEFGSENTLKR